MGQKKNINKGFSKIAKEYEELEKTSSLINWMRNKVRKNLTNNLKPNDSILEINCGSGIDAVFLASNGYKIHATDIAEGMLNTLKTKVNTKKLKENLSFQSLSFTDLKNVKNKPFNHIFSNFGGLNCSSIIELEKVFNSFKNILSENGKITLVIMPKICFWEIFSFLKGNKYAFRRLKKDGVIANIEGENVRTYYHSKSEIKQLLSNDFKNIKVENICFLGPAGYKIDFPKRHPFLFKITILLDKISNKIPFLQGIGDYYIITAERKI